jgi:hypothetical protein
MYLFMQKIISFKVKICLKQVRTDQILILFLIYSKNIVRSVF